MSDQCRMITPNTYEWDRAWSDLVLLFAEKTGIVGDTSDFNPEYNEAWQYMGTWRKDSSSPEYHQFRHRMHPVTQKREYVNVPPKYEITPTDCKLQESQVCYA